MMSLTTYHPVIDLIWGSLSNRDDDGNKNLSTLHIWQWKTVFLHALHGHISSFDISQTFSFFLRREMTCFAVVWTTWAYDDKCSILSSLCPKRWFQFNSKIVRTHFSSIMTLINLKMIAETRTYISRWRSRFRRRRVCFSSHFSVLRTWYIYTTQYFLPSVISTLHYFKFLIERRIMLAYQLICHTYKKLIDEFIAYKL